MPHYRSDSLDRLEAKVEGFISREYPRITYGAAAAFYDDKVFSVISDISDIESFDWPAWRLSVEFRMLQFRSNAVTWDWQLSTPAYVSRYFRLAYGLWLMGQSKMAVKVAQVLSETPASVIERFIRPKASPDALGAIGFFFDHLGIKPPQHKAFKFDADQLLTKDGLETALNTRKYYSNAAYEGGAISQGPEGDLLPLELIFLNQHLPDDLRDGNLSKMAECMANTTYPEDELFIELDTKLTIAGY